MTPSPSDDTISFDVDKFYLGALCKHGHDFHRSGYSLRYLSNKICVECKREIDLRWRKANPEKIREINRKWQRANPEKNRKKSRKWYEANTDKAREKIQKWQKANVEKIRESTKRRRLKKAQNKLLADLIKFQQLLQEQENDSKCSSIHP